MKKFTFPIIVLVVLILIGAYVWQDSNNRTNVFVGMFEGEVLSVDTSPLAYDGPAVIEMEATDGTMLQILVPAMINLCEASLEEYSTFESGDMIEVYGDVGDSGEIIPCASPDHYLRLTR